MTSKLAQFAQSIGTDAAQAQDALLKDIVTFLKSEYSRSALNRVISVGNDERFNPNVDKPTTSDVSLTVHIIALLQSKMTYLDFRKASGYFGDDFMMRAQIVHALKNEEAILAQQVAYVEGMDEKVSTLNPAKVNKFPQNV